MPSYKEEDIKHQTRNFWVLGLPKSGFYEVYQSGVTHSTRVASVSSSRNPILALKRAIETCNKRQQEYDAKTGAVPT